MRALYRRLPFSQNVYVHRTNLAFRERFDHGPMTIVAALQSELLSSDSGTVSVYMTVSDGPYASAQVYMLRRSPGQRRAPFITVFEYDDGTWNLSGRQTDERFPIAATRAAA